MVAELERLDARTIAPDLEREEIVQVYEDVSTKRRRRFPNNFFEGATGKQRAGTITRYLLEDKLEIAVEDIPRAIHKKLFYENGLTWMLGSCSVDQHISYPPFRICLTNLIIKTIVVVLIIVIIIIVSSASRTDPHF